ncbi:MAG: hypothetical protein AAFW46_06415 [Pseudomonadota bacterium]
MSANSARLPPIGAATLLALVLTGCGPALETDHRPTAITIRGEAYEILAPADAEIVGGEAGVVIDFAPGARQPRLLILGPALARARPRSTTIETAHGLRISFDADDGTAHAFIGSGGPEAVLDGWIETPDGRIFALSCRLQAESAPDPEWCLRVLETFRPAAARR